MNPDHLPQGPVVDALVGEMLVPKLGCSECATKDKTIAAQVKLITTLLERVRQQDHLIGISEQFIAAYREENTSVAQVKPKRHRISRVPKVTGNA